jgi:hypothetical protein
LKTATSLERYAETVQKKTVRERVLYFARTARTKAESQKASARTITAVNSHTTQEHEQTKKVVREVGEAVTTVHKKMEDIEDNVRKIMKALKKKKKHTPEETTEREETTPETTTSNPIEGLAVVVEKKRKGSPCEGTNKGGSPCKRSTRNCTELFGNHQKKKGGQKEDRGEEGRGEKGRRREG